MFKNMLVLLGILCITTYVTSTNDTKCVPKLERNLTESTQSSVIISILNNAKNLLDDAKKYASVKTSCAVADTFLCKKEIDCAEILERDPNARSGVYSIWPRSRISTGPINVHCDMQDDGGAWTIIQRRGHFDSDKEYFYKDWKSYKNGFGDLQKDFWLGNDNIFSLTNQRANIVKFTLTDWEGNKTYASYDEFWIEDESRKYTMHVSGYRGTAGDSFSGTNGVPFSTKDQDNDSFDGSCSINYKGAWWYTSCHSANLNGLYLKGPHESYADGVVWYAFRGHHYSLKDTFIKIRPKDFKTSPSQQEISSDVLTPQ